MNVGKFNDLEEILLEYGLHPSQGGVFGKKECARGARFNNPNYFLQVVRNDQTASFIYAVCDSLNSEGEYIVSCNSIPPGTNFSILSNVSSLDAWKDGYDVQKYRSQL